MKLHIGMAALAVLFTAGAAQAQTASETTTTQQSTVAPTAPAPGTLSTSKEFHATDGYGNQVNKKSTSYQNGNGVAAESSSTTTTNTAPPPPPPVSTTTSSSSTTTTAQPN